jgi:hypothetical protein
MGSNKNVVISFSIAILLLLSLLLLLTYNSKCSNTNNKMPMNLENTQIPSGFLADNEKYYNFENFASPADAVQTAQSQQSAASASAARSVANNYPSNPALASSGIGNYSPDNPDYNPSQMLDTPQSVNNDLQGQFMGGANGSNGVGGAGAAGAMGAGMQSCFPRDRLTANDLLPKDAADSKWARINPSGTGDIHDQNYLTAGYHVGINTVGQSLRNANLQLRSEIPNPQNAVGPWMISTIEPDLRQNTLEIGSSAAY